MVGKIILRVSWLWLVLAALEFGGARLRAEEASQAVLPPTSPLVITSISVADTNLVFHVSIPPKVPQVVLEMRPTLNAAWEPAAAAITVPAEGGDFLITIPKPVEAYLFYRLKAIWPSAPTNAPMVSSELEYVVMPSLATKLSEQGDAVFHFKGTVDGSDKIVITRDGATWTHVNWSWPNAAVTINGAAWNSQEKNYLTSTGATKFLPEPFSPESADLEVIGGRDVIALERATNALIVYLNDTPGGADDYEFKIRFHFVSRKPVAVVHSPAARLKIAAQIDGSDRIRITATEAVWEHKTMSDAAAVTLNGIAWDPAVTNVLANSGTNTFLPHGIDFSTARIIGRKGRDLATMWADKDAVWVSFADNPNGPDDYELGIAFGQ